MGADVSSAQPERSSAAPCGLLRRTVTTRERLDCAGRDWEGHDFHSCSPQPFIPCHPERAPHFARVKDLGVPREPGSPIMPAFGVMGWAMPRVLCEALLARLARFLIILLQDALAPITSPFWRSPERSGRGISRYVRGICFSPCLPSTHPPATQKSATTLSPFMGEITIGSTCRPHPRNKCHASR